jgi:hypothetical protein
MNSPPPPEKGGPEVKFRGPVQKGNSHAADRTGLTSSSRQASVQPRKGFAHAVDSRKIPPLRRDHAADHGESVLAWEEFGERCSVKPTATRPCAKKPKP